MWVAIILSFSQFQRSPAPNVNGFDKVVGTQVVSIVLEKKPFQSFLSFGGSNIHRNWAGDVGC